MRYRVTFTQTTVAIIEAETQEEAQREADRRLWTHPDDDESF
jgi:hypothetical protein